MVRWQLVHRQVCPHSVKGAGELCGISFIRALLPLMRLHPHALTTSQRCTYSYYHPWGLGLQHIHFEETHSDHTRCLIWEREKLRSGDDIYMYSITAREETRNLICLPWEHLPSKSCKLTFFRGSVQPHSKESQQRVPGNTVRPSTFTFFGLTR